MKAHNRGLARNGAASATGCPLRVARAIRLESPLGAACAAVFQFGLNSCSCPFKFSDLRSSQAFASSYREPPANDTSPYWSRSRAPPPFLELSAPDNSANGLFRVSAPPNLRRVRRVDGTARARRLLPMDSVLLPRT